jgi:hypothetical protein
MAVVRAQKVENKPGTTGSGPRARKGVARRWVVLSIAMGWRATAFGQQMTTSDPPPPPQPPGGSAPVVGPQLPAPAPDPGAVMAAEKADREAAVRAARDEMQSSVDGESFVRAAETADLRVAVEALKDELARRGKEADGAAPSVRAGRLGIGLTGFVQTDLTFRQSSEDQLNTSTGEPLNQNRFLVRRARLRATLDRTYVAGAFELDGNTVNGPAARIAGAEASLKWIGGAPAGAPPLIMGTIGLFKIPFGFEVGESDRDRLFLERTMTSRALFPGEYDVGARLLGGWRFLRYMLAFQNGEPIGERLFPARDPNHQKDIMGRLGIDTGEDGPFTVRAGFSALTGTGLHKGTAATKPSVQWIDSNEDGSIDPSELRASPGLSATPSINFPRHALGADARLTLRLAPVGATTAYAEMYYAKDLDRAVLVADPTGALGAVGRSYRELGWYVAVMQDLTAHVTVGARYDYYNPDRDGSDQRAGRLVPNTPSYSTWTLVAALQAPAGRLIVEYDINRNHLGRDATGVPTNLKDNAVSVRGEARF